MSNTYLSSISKQFQYYKSLGEKTFDQLSFEDLQKEFAEDANSIAIIVKHLVGNMLSRWTNFLTEDGEKTWRERDQEFIDSYTNRDDLMQSWDLGWDCLFKSLKALEPEDLEKLVYIRNQGHTVTEAINRQLAHYAYHIGQIVFIGKVLKGKDWNSLSIPKGKSDSFNHEKFAREKRRAHFTDEQ